MSPNIARPLTLRTIPSDYATFNQIRSFLIFNIRLLQAKYFYVMFSRLGRGRFRQNLPNDVKNFLTLISTAPGFKLFTLNQVIDEVNC